MGRGCVAASRAKDNWCVVAWAREESREWQGGVVSRAGFQLAALESFDPLARQFVGPRSNFAGRLVGSVEVHHQPMLSCFFQQRVIIVDDFLSFVIEEIYFDANDAYAL